MEYTLVTDSTLETEASAGSALWPSYLFMWLLHCDIWWYLVSPVGTHLALTWPQSTSTPRTAHTHGHSVPHTSHRGRDGGRHDRLQELRDRAEGSHDLPQGIVTAPIMNNNNEDDVRIFSPPWRCWVSTPWSRTSWTCVTPSPRTASYFSLISATSCCGVGGRRTRKCSDRECSRWGRSKWVGSSRNLQILCGTEPFPELYRAKKYKFNDNYFTRNDFKHIMLNLPVEVVQ